MKSKQEVELKPSLEIQIKLELAWQQLCERIKSFALLFLLSLWHIAFLLGVFCDIFIGHSTKKHSLNNWVSYFLICSYH